MIGIVIVAHGSLAQEYLGAALHVVGQQPMIEAISTSAEFNRDAKQQEICEAADRVDTGAGVVVVVDMFGSSPSNLSMKACSGAERKILYGANLPMLVKLIKCRSLPVEEATRRAVEAGRKYMDAMDGT